MPPTAKILTLGCKVNQFESAAMAAALRQAGYVLVPASRPADLTVVNTCTVTAKADFEARALIRRAHRLNPLGRTVVAGCLAQVRPEDLRDLPGVVLVIGQAKADLVRLLASLSNPNPTETPGVEPDPAALAYPSFDRTRAFFRIQDGCSAGCAYCAVPAARGPSRGLTSAAVLAGIEHYAAQGYQEVVLTGIHLGSWGLDLDPPSTLVDLLNGLAARPGPRLRLSSLEPREISPPVWAELAASGRFCPHLHLPLQSGADRILEAMGRPYTGTFFADLVRDLAAAQDDLCLGTDILVGFPGEEPEDFAQTYGLLADSPVAYFHVFPYSPRPGTRAALLGGTVTEGEKKRRVLELRELSGKKRLAFQSRHLGTVRPTLIENSRDRTTGLGRGLTDNYLQVLICGTLPRAGTIERVRLTGFGPDGRILGEPE